MAHDRLEHPLVVGVQELVVGHRPGQYASMGRRWPHASRRNAPTADRSIELLQRADRSRTEAFVSWLARAELRRCHEDRGGLRVVDG